MNEVFRDAKEQIENPGMTRTTSSVVRFIYMKNLEDEMRMFLKEHGIDISITEEDAWVSFVGLLVKVLENQPIHNPNDDISLFTFIPATDRCVRGVIQFTKSINGYNHFNFGNAY